MKAPGAGFYPFRSRPDLRDRVVFFEDYDITSAQRMVEGVDVWINGKYRFLAELYLSDLDPSFACVELYADAFEAQPGERMAARCEGPITGAVNGYFYSVEIRAVRPVSDYTFRVAPYHAEARVPLEENHILWQK